MKKRLYILLFLLILWSSLYCQVGSSQVGAQDRPDSLEFEYLGSIIDSAITNQEWIAAESLSVKLVRFTETRFGPTNNNTLSAYQLLSEVYWEQGKYTKAEPPLKYVVKITGQVIGKETEVYASFLNVLGLCLKYQGKFTEAESLYQVSIDIMESLFGKDHPDVAIALNNLAVLFTEQGKYLDAEMLYQRTLEIREKSEHPDSALLAQSLNNIAFLYETQGRYVEAIEYYKKALHILENYLEENHPDLAVAMHNLAVSYYYQEKYVEAEEYLRSSLSILENYYGPSHPEVAYVLNDLAGLYNQLGEYHMAQELLYRALDIRTSMLGKEHPDVILSLNNLAFLHENQGNYTIAESLYREALAVTEKVYGSGHPNTAFSMSALAFCLEGHGQIQEAGSLYILAKDIFVERLVYSAGYMSEENLMHYLDRNYEVRKKIEDFIFNNYSDDPQLLGHWYDYLLAFKGAVGRSATALRAVIASSGDSLQITSADRMIELREEIANLEALDDSNNAVLIIDLESEANSIEQQLTLELAAYRDFDSEFKVKWQDIKGRLDKGEGAIEFTTAFSNRDSSMYYVALVLRKNTQFPSLVTIASIEAFNDVMESYTDLALNVLMGKKVKTINEKLYQALWVPLESEVQGLDKIFICPEGELFKLNLGILADQSGRLVMEKYDIRIVNSTLDIVMPSITTSNQPCVIFGGPDYTWKALDETVPFLVDSNTTSLHFEPLPSSLEEAEAVRRILEKFGLDVKVYTGSDATEQRFKQIDSPRILHVATHGFVIEEDEKYDTEISRISLPMANCGLAFAGANKTSLTSSFVYNEEDGLLTGAELMGINLQGTELVVLSACETGLGKTKRGEGVFGLRRAIQLAGGKYVIISLWPLPDKETRELMEVFYRVWLGGLEIQEALRKAQLEMRRKVIELYGFDAPLFWGGLIIIGK